MITISVGDKEKHTVSFSYDSTWGKAQIFVDGKEYSSARILFIGQTPFTFQVGDKEKHIVRIELNNPLWFAVRGSRVKMLVDEAISFDGKIGGSIATFFILMTSVLIPILTIYFVLMK
jgi:hypothetical protein